MANELKSKFFEDVNIAFETAFNKSYEALEGVSPLVYSFDSGKKYTEFPISKFSSKIREWKGQRQHDDPTQAFKMTLTYKKYDGAVDIDAEDWREAEQMESMARLNMYKDEVESLSMEAKDFADEKSLDYLLAGAGSTLGVCFDGQNLFDTTHAFDSVAGTQSNLLTGTGTSLAQLKTDYETALSAMGAFYREQGEGTSKQRYLNRTIKPRVMCPAVLYGKFTELQKADLIDNETNIYKNSFELVRVPTGDAKDWYLVNNDGGKERPILSPMAGTVKLTTPVDAQAQLVEYDRLSYGVRFSRGFGYGAWWKVIKVDNS